MLKKLAPSETSRQIHLSKLSPKDKSWDKHKSESEKVVHLYEDSVFGRYAARMGGCSGYLSFNWVLDEATGELNLKLKGCRFCRCRHCPICQWRRSLMWIARFLGALPAIVRDYPSARYIFLTLTVKNCQLQELRQTLDSMNKAWQRLSQRKAFPAIGFARATEVTRAADDTAHPHFHALLMVDPGYFAGKNYLTQGEWAEMWRSCLKVDYTPIVHVQAVKNRRKRVKGQNRLDTLLDGSDASERILAASESISDAVFETFKYAVKPGDLIGAGSESDRRWLVELTQQLRKTRAIALGGVFKDYLSEDEPEDLIGNDLDVEDKISDITFGWREVIQRYVTEKI